jgi:hypothetical protein
MKPPNFFIVGAPKAGTTSLYRYLSQHPQVYMSALKEPNYFASELRLENFTAAERRRVARATRALEQYLHGATSSRPFGGLISTWTDYTQLFRDASDQIAVGEASACYLWSPSAARNIAARIPQARIIISLRNPVDRAFSQYLHMVTDGVIRGSFRQQIAANLRCHHRQFGAQWPFLEFGYYHEQVKRYLREFPASHVHISLHEDLERRAQSLVAELFEFLGVDPGFAVDVSARHNEPRVPRFTSGAYLLKKWRIWPYLGKLAPRSFGPQLRSLAFRSRATLVMEPADRALLTEYYRDDVTKLAALLDRDLSAWLR